jgi:hypothetical protein
MNIAIIALYEGILPEFEHKPGVFLRRRRDGSMWTQILCDLVQQGGRWQARPPLVVPAHAPPADFRAQPNVERGRIPTDGVALVLRAPFDEAHGDAPREILAPILVTPRRFLFEFTRGIVLRVCPKGGAEARLVAVDRRTGSVGTRTLAYFHTSYLALAERLGEQIRGGADLFPADPRRGRDAGVPAGEAKLSWDERRSESEDPGLESIDGLFAGFPPEAAGH